MPAPKPGAARGATPATTARRRAPSPEPLTDAELDELQQCLADVPAPLEALDVSMVDGFLCGVLLQPQPVAASRWLPFVTDVEGRALPRGADVRRLHDLLLRRHAELDAAIAKRRWFDPWVFELDEGSDDEGAAVSDAVYPWVAGFATALETFPGLLAFDAAEINEPLALVYRHLASDDLEDADELLAEIESLEPPADLSAAVEELVRATLLLADVSRPLPARRPPRMR
ncbi:MAG TPA: UPF0149 family protein [Burkholderiaceae bacterium]